MAEINFGAGISIKIDTLSRQMVKEPVIVFTESQLNSFRLQF